MDNFVIFPGFEEKKCGSKRIADYFCSFSTFNVFTVDNEKRTLHLINYTLHDKALIYCFNINRFYITTSLSTCYGNLIADIGNYYTDLRYRGTSINGLDVSNYNRRFILKFSVFSKEELDEIQTVEYNESDEECKLSVKEFSMLVLDLCLENDYSEQLIKQTLVKYFKNWYKTIHEQLEEAEYED